MSRVATEAKAYFIGDGERPLMFPGSIAITRDSTNLSSKSGQQFFDQLAPAVFSNCTIGGQSYSEFKKHKAGGESLLILLIDSDNNLTFRWIRYATFLRNST
jgi:hypothetical protein